MGFVGLEVLARPAAVGEAAVANAIAAGAGLGGSANLVALTAVPVIRLEIDATSGASSKSVATIGFALALVAYFVGSAWGVTGAAVGGVVRGINAGTTAISEGRRALALPPNAAFVSSTAGCATAASGRVGL